ncbi:MAG: dTDP-4-amino-4,6-dideoxygalactose transaminase, partial [Flavobacteriia bacterium]|nr:dTDP-4-amino-4,6-dideoxygalactose transaminase [Flavobacteriia bacterium]
DGRALINSDKFTARLVRLPMYYELDVSQVVDKLVKYAE